MNRKTRVRRPKVEKGLSRKYDSEKIVSQTLLNGYQVKGSRGEQLIEQLTGRSYNQIRMESILKIVAFFAEICDLKVERNIKRRKDLLVKWLQDNEEEIEVFKDHIKIDIG